MIKLRKFIGRILMPAIYERVAWKGYLVIHKRRGPGSPWQFVLSKRNVITKGGMAQLALLWGDGAAAANTVGKVGTGTNAASVNDTQLQTEVDEVAGTFTRFQTTYPNDTCRLVSLHTAPVGGWAITEYAAAAIGTPDVIWNRVVFAAVNLAEGEQIQMTYENQITEVA